jgi:1-acyl-sn-glycerol-3-phosphate acyltransferase
VRKDWFFRGFRDRYVRGYLRKHFHAVRLSRSSAAIPADDRPVVVVLNHPSWWDPLICTLLSGEFGRREHYGVIDEAMLKKYGFFRWLGFFGVDPNTLRGAARFLRTAIRLLNGSNRVLWITAQGEFSDVRQRPLNLKSGVGHLAARLDRVAILPVAFEYAFWTERTPEALIRIGPVIEKDASTTRTPEEWTGHIEAGLTETLDRLNAETITRDPRQFTTLLGGKSGVGGVYGLWQRFKSLITGHPYQPAHDDSREPS